LNTPTAPHADLTVVMLTRRPGPELRASLDSVGWAREIIVLDDGSDDRTLALLREHGAVVMQQDRDLIRAHEGNFDVARNPGFDRASASWIFVLDSDEVVSAELRDEILRAITSPEQAAYEVPRANLYWGQPSRVLGEDRQLRLFPRGAGRYRGTQLDRPPEVDCTVRTLGAPLLHRQKHLLRKLNARTDQRARRAARRDATAGASGFSLFWHHLRWYAIGQQSWRDGPRGIALAVIYAAYPALEAVKTRRLVRQRLSESAP